LAIIWLAIHAGRNSTIAGLSQAIEQEVEKCAEGEERDGAAARAVLKSAR